MLTRNRGVSNCKPFEIVLASFVYNRKKSKAILRKDINCVKLSGVVLQPAS